MGLMRSPATAVHLVTLLEEMPVQETLDGIDELTAAGLPVGAVIVNAVRDELLPAKALDAADAGRLDAAQVRAGLAAAGLVRKATRTGTAMADGLIEQGPSTAAVSRCSVGSARPSKSSSSPATSCRYLAGASTSAASTSSPTQMRRQGLRDEHVHVRRCRTSTSTCCSTTCGIQHDRLLRLRRSGQDHDGGRARAARRGAGPPGGRADHRPGPPAGAVHGPRAAGQHTAPGGRRRHRRRRQASTR